MVQMDEFDEVIGVYTFWMRAEHGDALFFDHWDECYGNADTLKTFDHDTIDLSGVAGLRAWYDRFDREERPVAEWPAGEYQAWVEEGWQYAYALRELVPDHFDLIYEYEENGKFVTYTIPRKSRLPDVAPSTREAERLIREADEQIDRVIFDIREESGAPVFDRDEETKPLFMGYIRRFCEQCPDDRVLAKAHCVWNENAKELIVQWYLDDFKARCIIGREDGFWEIESKRIVNWHPGDPPKIHDFECTLMSLEGNFAVVLLGWMQWYIVERGLK